MVHEFNVTTIGVSNIGERLLLMAIIAGVNKKIELGRDFTKQKTDNLREFFL